MKKIFENITNNIAKNKIIKVIISVVILLIITIIGSVTVVINRINENTKKEKITEFEWEVYDVSGKMAYIEAIFRNEDGIEKLIYPNTDETGNDFKVYPNGKTQIAVDLKLQDRKSYEFEIETSTGERKKYTLDAQIPRIVGNYVLKDGIYVDEPDVSTGIVHEKTRYLYLDSNDNLVPGNWTNSVEPENWYNYKNKQWANIYVENNGVESYYVWIPRYMYKVDTQNSVTGNERMDVKFINTYNEYIDAATGKVTTYEELVADGYKLPEAFTWKYKESNMSLIIPGYWASKYQLSDLGSYKINYNLTATKTTFNVNTFTNNVADIAASYTYAINGQIVNTSTTLADYSFTNSKPDGTNYINVTALDNQGRIVGSMTKELELAEVNPPDLTGLDPNTTFYVYWDEEGNEHNEIPISKEPPTDWYNYSYSSWANIVTRNNGVETYFVWIPRYQYLLDQTSQRSNIRFIKGTGTELFAGYKIPEAFTWTNNAGEQVEITGYWATKYQLSIEETTPKVDVEIATDINTVTINEITGTVVNQSVSSGVTVNYEYYVNEKLITTQQDGDYMPYTFGGFKAGYTYIINVILRDANTNKYLGAVTKKVLITSPNQPELKGLNENNTYYVEYQMDESGNLHAYAGDKIKNDGSNIPESWYSYQDRIWANIVVTDGTVTNGQITGATTISYFTWIPRYEYRILTDRGNLSTANRRTEVNFLSGTSMETSAGYKIPESFTWVNNAGETVQIPGYWASKYQLSE